MTIWDCRTHVRMTSMTSSVERTDLDFKISAALCCGYSLELPHRGDSSEYPQHMFLWNICYGYSLESPC